MAKRLESEWNATDCAQVRRDVIAGNAIAAGGTNGELPPLVTQADRDTVGFWLDDPVERFSWQQFLDALDELAHLLLRVGIVETHHRHGVTHRLEAVDRLAANALARRVGRAQLRVRGLEVEQLTVKLIVLAVADRRLCLDIISPVMPTNLIGQFSVPLLW